MFFLSNPQVWHLPGTWSEKPIDGPYLGMTSSQLNWLTASILVTLYQPFLVEVEHQTLVHVFPKFHQASLSSHQVKT